MGPRFLPGCAFAVAIVTVPAAAIVTLPAVAAAQPALAPGAEAMVPAARSAAEDTSVPGAAGIPGREDSTGVAVAETLAARPAGVDYLWVVRTALLRPTDIDRIIARAGGMGVRGLLVQVVGRGDAFFRSDQLPRAEALGTREAADTAFDPLGELLIRAHQAGLEVHAWINCMLVWSAPQPPRDPRHVINAHPEWIARMRDGRPMSELGGYERGRLGVEGIYLSPVHPGVRTWLARIAKELAERYPIDGIHLDYIRQPGVAVGFDPMSRARFEVQTGVDPVRLSSLPTPEAAAFDSAWTAFQCDQVTAAVREVRDSLNAVRPGLALSAAVLADTLDAARRHAQRWPSWVRSGLVDRVFVMCYAPVVQTVMDQLLTYANRLGVSERVVPGIAVYNTSPALAAAKIQGARALGYPLLALYSYDALEERTGYWTALRGRLLPAAPGRGGR